MDRNAYWIPSLALAALIASGATFLSVATYANASWPFAAAKADDGSTPVMHDAELDLLAAATNPDPNPAKGGADIQMTEGAALISNSGPNGSIVYVESRKSKGAITTYTVQEGDSLSTIAETYGVSMNTVLWANNISDAKLIKPGMDLVILPVTGVKYTVQKGDTVAGVAKKFNGKSDDIIAYNGVDVSTGLTAGSTIIIPGGSVTPAKAAATKATTKKASSAAARALPALSGFFGNPLPGGRLTQGLHGYNGVDIGAPAGTPIYAAAAGSVIVAKAGGYNGGYGSYVVIKHSNGSQTLYAHMSSVAASTGSVEKGALIGYVGSTGKSTGNHLHFEVRGAKNPFAK